MTPPAPPRVLPPLTGLDEARLEAGVILWNRFCVVGEPRRDPITTAVTVTDLERELGDAGEQHRLDLHLLPISSDARERARLDRALALGSDVQPELLATGLAGERLVLICAPSRGRSTDDATVANEPRVRLARAELLELGRALAGLLVELHAANVIGVRFNFGSLRSDDGRARLDRFDHLFTPETERSETHDVVGLATLIDELAGAELELSLGSPASATDLHARLVALATEARQPALPTDPPFVGRTRALAELGQGLAQAQIAQPTAIVVKGQRGVGKSRLIAEFVAARRAGGDALVLTGAWQERSADSRGGLLNALDQLPDAIAALGPEERDDVRHRINRSTRHLGAIVTRSAPSLGALLRDVDELPPLELGEDFSRHTAVIADLLRAVGSSRRPLILVLDNLESIDASSAAVLRILTQQRPAHHTLVLMALRVGAGHAGDRRSPDAFEAELEFRTVELAPLSTDELGQLLSESLPGTLADSLALSQTLWSVSGGLPLAAWTNLRAWLERGRLTHADGTWTDRHRTRGRQGEDSGRLEVYDVFGARLAATSGEVRELALRVAVLGAELDNEGLSALRELSEIDVDAAIAELVECGILLHDPSGVRFPHDSIREFVFETFDERHRRAAHEFAAAMLVRRAAPIAQIAYHRDLGLDPKASAEQFDQLSRLHVDAGRERLSIYDLERARWHLERALEHSRDPSQRNLAAEGLADICLLIDDVDTAVSLYTAIIATSEPAHAVATAAKSVSFLFSKSANTEARQLATMALEVVAEPIPTTPFGKLAALIATLVRSRFRLPKHEIEVREALCRLYPWLTIMSLVADPLAVPMYVARSRWIAKGLKSGSAAVVGGIAGSMWASLGRYDAANQIFAASRNIADQTNDAWAQGFVSHSWAHVSLLPADRYEEGQDMLDDAIAAYRETGDVSVSVLSILFKALYGRDREPADKILGWIDEAVATSRRNGKFVATASLEALRLHVLARQGRVGLEGRFAALAAQLDAEDMTEVERLMARVHLAYAAYEAQAWEIAIVQVRAGQTDIGKLPGVPEYCHEIHLVTALVLLARPSLDRRMRRELHRAVRKFRRASSNSPRLKILRALLELELSLSANDRGKALATAVKIIADLDRHENLHVARKAHFALAQLLEVENVFAAAEHARVGRKLGLRLGLHERALFGKFTDTEEQVERLGIELDAGLEFDESQQDIPAAGMLSSAVTGPGSREQPTTASLAIQADVLEAWALDSTVRPTITLADVLDPVEEAMRGSIDAALLQIDCADLTLMIPIASGDLQIALINLLLACRDAVGPSVVITARIGLDTTKVARQLSVRVSAPSPAHRVPVINAYAACERLVHNLGGRLGATVDPREVSLTALLPI